MRCSFAPFAFGAYINARFIRTLRGVTKSMQFELFMIAGEGLSVDHIPIDSGKICIDFEPLGVQLLRQRFIPLQFQAPQFLHHYLGRDYCRANEAQGIKDLYNHGQNCSLRNFGPFHIIHFIFQAVGGGIPP